MGRRIFLICLASGALLGAAKPDFSGQWKIDLDKSDFGSFPKPEKMERTIEHKDPSMKVTTLQKSARGEFTTESKYTTDGKETVVPMRGREAKVTAKWIENKLQVESKSEFNGMALSQKETWTLSDDGKSLTIENQVVSTQGEFKTKLVFTKGS